MEYCEDQTSRVCQLCVNALLQSCLRPFASVTSVNALLSRGVMWVLSRDQFREHLAQAGVYQPHTLLDIGAGDGNVTNELASCVSGPVCVTEADPIMRYRLRRRGYRCLAEDAWERHGPFDVIACLNVLDRCDRPMTLLRQMRDTLTPGSGAAIVVATVFPFRPFVEVGAARRAPTEFIEVPGHTIEEHVIYFSRHVFPASGLRVVAVSKAPYLCEGDVRSSLLQSTLLLFL